MIRTVGVTQVKYCYRMNINSMNIKYNLFNMLSEEAVVIIQNCGEMPCQSQNSPPALRQACFLTSFSAMKRNSTFNSM